jgi:peptidoglycan/LPS O-acetylase OafA/YrhL
VPRPVEGTSPYLPGLDGIRAIAVLAVIAYHLNFGWAPGGLLGVQVFFVLSGYLITDLLVSEHRRTGGIGLARFWVRRARRLFPALFVMMFVVVAVATLFDRGQLSALRSDTLPGIFYMSNWWFIFQHVSYFAKFGPPSPFGHLWSLAIEEQFYLLWPLVVLAGFRWVRTTRVRILITLGLAAASALEMAILYTPGGDPTRVYDGTDTRAFALLIGAALALVLPRNRRFGPITPNARRMLNLVGGASLAGIFVMFWGTNQYQTFLYTGGMVLLSVLTALVIAITVHPGAGLRRLLGVEPLRWIGERSYGIYLWHYPIIVLTTPLNAPANVWRGFLQTTATFLIAALSWRYIEQPIRHGALRRGWERVRAREWRQPRLRPIGWVLVGAAVLDLVVSSLGLFGVVSASAADPASEVTSIVPRDHRDAPRPSTAGTTLPGASTTSTVPPPAGQGVTAVGDSVLVDAAPYLEQMLPGIAIDAQVGQQLEQVQAAVGQLKAEGAVGTRLVIELGTNGPYSSGQLEDLVDSFGPMQKIVFVNTRVPRPWQEQVNSTIAQVAATYPNAVVVNWYDDSATTPQYFYPDGVHLDPAGARYYATLITQAVEAPLPPPPAKKSTGKSRSERPRATTTAARGATTTSPPGQTSGHG